METRVRGLSLHSNSSGNASTAAMAVPGIPMPMVKSASNDPLRPPSLPRSPPPPPPAWLVAARENLHNIPAVSSSLPLLNPGHARTVTVAPIVDRQGSPTGAGLSAMKPRSASITGGSVAPRRTSLLPPRLHSSSPHPLVPPVFVEFDQPDRQQQQQENIPPPPTSEPDLPHPRSRKSSLQAPGESPIDQRRPSASKESLQPEPRSPVSLASQPSQLQPDSRTRRLTMKFHESRRLTTALWSMASEQDLDVDDELTKAQKRLKDIKSRISSQSKRNFLLERDVRYLDSRIALLIQNRMALDEEMTKHLVDEGTTDSAETSAHFPDDRKKQLYGNLFFLLQTEPRLVAHLTRLVTLSEIDTLLQTVMFTLYGNQYDSREEHLLLTMFQSVLTEQFESATDFGSLLRANTPASRMLTTYTRRGPGQQYLKLVLSGNLNRLLEDQDLNLEINPLKVYEQMINQQEVETGQDSELPRGISADEATQNPDVQAIIRPRIRKLIEIANYFLQTILDSLDQVPYGIRWICKQIMNLTKEKYPDASNWSICSLIGGFFFLRFINPAIITPQSYMIIDQQPAKHPRRTLTLVAKMLQNLANKPSYSKELYMMELNPFVEDNKERIAKFLNDLCLVDDFYESLELDQYMALSLKDLNINISLNEIYSMHTLLLKHSDTICAHPNAGPASSPAVVASPASHRSSMTPEQSYFISCHHLRLLLTDLGASAPTQLSRQDNKTLPLALFARWEMAPILFPQMAEAMSTTESVITHSGATPSFKTSNAMSEQDLDADILFMETRALIIQIMRKQAVIGTSREAADHFVNNHIYAPVISISNVPKHFKPSHINVEEILVKSVTQTQKCARARQNLRVLEDRYHHPLIRRADGYYDLAQAIHVEFLALKALLGKLRGERESLENVYKTICDHNQYLRSQLESYKAYLQNVRIQTAAGGSSVKVGVAPASIVTSPRPRELSNASKAAKKSAHQASSVRLKFSHAQLEKDGIITESGVPENRRGNIYFSLKSPSPGSFLIGLHYKGREKPIVEVELQLDDLLEKQQENVQILDLEYVQLNVNKVLHLLNKSFLKR